MTAPATSAGSAPRPVYGEAFTNRPEVGERVNAAQAYLATLASKKPKIGDPSTECDCGDCEYVGTDCCGEPRPDCEVTSGPDGDDGRISVCETGFGCAPTEEERYAEIARLEDEYWASAQGQAEMDRQTRENGQEYTDSREDYTNLSTIVKEPRPAEGKNLIYSRGYPYGAPAVYVRGGATRVAEVKQALKEAGFQWDGQSHAWKSYGYQDEFEGGLFPDWQERFGFNLQNKSDQE